MARIGIVILLTGLVFLANYAYHRIIPLLGPWGKLALLTLAGGGLAGLGAWMEQTRKSLENYGRVLLAGGAATLYYTAYAAHFVPAVRVIESPLLGGAALLLLAGGIVWFADRRRSEPVALLAIGLSYYTSAINPVGAFTLFSNVILAAIGVFFLIRRQWSRLAWLTLGGAYASYAFCRYAAPSGLDALPVFTPLAFLAICWALFAAAVFLAKGDAFPAGGRVGFLTLNNAAFYGLAAHHLAERAPDSFWLLSIILGAALLTLSAVAAHREPEESALGGACLGQGILFATIGIIAHFTGASLAIILAVESALLIAAGLRRHEMLCHVAAAISALLALGWTLWEIRWAPAPPALIAAAIFGVFLFNAWSSKKLRVTLRATTLDLRAFLYSSLALIVAWALAARLAPQAWEPLVLSAFAVAGLAALLIALPEAALLAQAFLVLGIGAFAIQEFESSSPWWMAGLHAGIALGLMHWWQKQRLLALSETARIALEAAAAFGAVLAAAAWLEARCDLGCRLLAMSAAAVATLLYAWATRARPLAAAGQTFTVLGISAFAASLLEPATPWWAALAPVANLAITAAILRRVPPSAAGGISLAPAVTGFHLAASLMLGIWGFAHVESEWRMAFFAALAGAHFLLASARHSRERALVGAAYSAAAYLLFWARLGGQPKTQDLLAILVIPASMRFARWWRGGDTLQERGPIVIAAAATLWLWVTTFAAGHGWHDYLTAAWGLLALAIFTAGLLLRERIYRLAGFGILALAVGRLFAIDVWSFDTLYRIVAFLLLGAVLLVLSCIYSRCAESMRRWL